MSDEITAILMSYKRKPNMPKIIKQLRAQSHPPKEIWMVNNDGYDSFGADKVIAIPWNAGEMARYLWTRRAETPWVMFQDDDWIMRDVRFLEDALFIAKTKALRACTGTAGRTISPTPKHYDGRREALPDSYTNFLKGHFQLFHQDSLTDLHVGHHPNASDIWFSLDISHGRKVHWVSANLRSRFQLMDQHGQGLEHRKGHWAEREKACADYVREYGGDYAWET